MITKTKTYKSDASHSIHELASALHSVGAINKETMNHFDESCLTQIHDFTPETPKIYS